MIEFVTALSININVNEPKQWQLHYVGPNDIAAMNAKVSNRGNLKHVASFAYNPVYLDGGYDRCEDDRIDTVYYRIFRWHVPLIERRRTDRFKTVWTTNLYQMHKYMYDYLDCPAILVKFADKTLDQPIDITANDPIHQRLNYHHSLSLREWIASHGVTIGHYGDWRDADEI